MKKNEQTIPQSVREYPHRPLREQGRREEQASESEDDHFPPEDESSVLRDLRQEQLQFREALPLSR